MGKSIKKNPYCTDNNHSKKSKKQASKIVRRKLNNGEDIPDGNAYKKVTESMDICDYKFRLTEKEALEDYYRYLKEDELNGSTFIKDRYPTEEDFMKWWKKHYVRK